MAPRRKSLWKNYSCLQLCLFLWKLYMLSWSYTLSTCRINEEMFACLKCLDKMSFEKASWSRIKKEVPFGLQDMIPSVSWSSMMSHINSMKGDMIFFLILLTFLIFIWKDHPVPSSKYFVQPYSKILIIRLASPKKARKETKNTKIVVNIFHFLFWLNWNK